MSLDERLRKANWLKEFRVLVIAGIVLISGFTLAEMVMVALGRQVVAELRTNPTGPQEFTVGGHVMEHQLTQVAITDPSPAQALWYLGTELPSIAVLLAALFMLQRLLSRARRRDPFTPDTVRGLRWLGIVLMVGGSAASLLESAATIGLSQGLIPDTISASWDVPVAWLFAGFAVMAIGQIVARGCALREELDEVI